MLRSFRVKNFKGWRDTGPVRLAPLTIFFGKNSSGKSSLLQSALMMKQTAEALDPKQVFNLGDPDSYVDLGTYQDLIFEHDLSRRLFVDFAWTTEVPVALRQVGPNPLSASEFSVQVEVGLIGHGERILGEIKVYSMDYIIGTDGERRIGLHRRGDGYYELLSRGMRLSRRRDRPGSLPDPVKFYGFPDAVFNVYQNVDFLADLSLQFDDLMSSLSYVGPLRERPQRTYQWRGSSPTSVGPRGENTVAAILAARRESRIIGRLPSRGHPFRRFEENLGYWLNKMGIIDDFALEEIAPRTDLYELKVSALGGSTHVSVTDVGFGVSQVLPVLVQIFYAPRRSAVILEQPEIHLHPAAQSELGDVLLHAMKDNDVQLLVETHSEHLLRRIQRRIAETEITNDDVALYFVVPRNGESELHELKIDQYGNVANWPEGFFGDEIGDLTAMTDAAIRRRSQLS